MKIMDLFKKPAKTTEKTNTNTARLKAKTSNAVNGTVKTMRMVGRSWSRVPGIRYLKDYFSDPWIRWQAKVMFVLWMLTWIIGLALSVYALIVMPLTITHFLLTGAFAIGAATLFWVAVHDKYMVVKLREERASKNGFY